MSRPIYTVTAVYTSSDKSIRGDKYRTFGFFHDLEEAREAASENWGEMHECLYNYLVIESYREGIHSIGDMIDYYKWDYDNNKWLKLDSCPKRFRGVCCLGLG